MLLLFLQVTKNCHCSQRLKIGTVIAKRIRDKIFDSLGITTSCGIGRLVFIHVYQNAAQFFSKV